LIVLDENGLAIDTIYTDETGKFQYEKLKGELNYTFKPLNEKSFDADDLVLLTDNVVMEEDVTIKEDPESVSQEGYSLSNSIYFNFNEVFLTKGDYAALDKIIENKEKIREVILEGHTDNLGSEETNMKVAKLRIESAANYLIKRGLDKNIIKRIPFGERKPIEDNSTKEGRAKNRRVVSFCN
jgi:outer membrane protein OmpA-like peptidoglycan-associated protein